jgi:hypothetical protein
MNGPSKLECGNGPNMLECFIALGWKVLPMATTLAYWAFTLAMITIKFCEYNCRDRIHCTSFSS